MLLALDVGNTNVTIGLYDGSERRGHWRLRTERQRTADEYAVMLSGLLALDGFRLRDVEAVVIANVVPSTRRPLAEFCERHLCRTPSVVGENLLVPLASHYTPASDVGADRLVNAFAAARLHGTPAVVVDFGTATTFDAVGEDGAYAGGAIAPGVGISLDALFQSAARLPRVELVKPERVIGRTTVESLQSGALYGFAGQIDGVVRRFLAELGGQARVIATGGLASWIAPETETIDVVDPFLTLEGLSLLWRESHCPN
jgi:type III pantothenate kinase